MTSSKKIIKRYRVETLGCRTNQYESAAYKDQLLSLGILESQKGEEADLCIVNTCTVTEAADSSSRHQIRGLLRKNPEAQVWVTGCMAERKKDEIEALSKRIRVVPNANKELLVNWALPQEEVGEFKIKHFESKTRAFVKVQDGCNSFCSYCVIPYVRGRSRSRKLSEVVAEVEGLVAQGYKEVVITGINVGDYDGGKKRKEGPDSLSDLVRAVDQVEGLERLRISSIDPDEVDDDLLDAVINGKTTCPSMHIVLQSGSNVVLKRMYRKYTRQIFYETCQRLKAACPDFTFTTDVIVGFPGESEADFEETLAVMREIRFAKVHMFPYSSRPGTKAANYEGQVEEGVKQRRKNEVLRLSEKIAYELREAYVGRVLPVLTEARVNEEYISGHTHNFLEVKIGSKTLEPNELVRVKLLKNEASCLVGELVS